MRLEQIMSRSAVKVLPTDRVTDVARIMRDEGISSVLVCEPNGVLVGILTERDFAHKIIAEGLACEGLCIGDFMTRNPITADSRDRVWEGARLMAEHRIRHLPVTRNGTPVGVVTSNDISGMESDPTPTRDVIRGLEATSRERTVEIPVAVGASDLSEIIPAWY
ncbi:MAG: CBS domain-containing protein [Actinomycetota bacterium]